MSEGDAVGSDDVWSVIESIYETGQDPGEWAELVERLVGHLEAGDRRIGSDADTHAEERLAPHFERAEQLVEHVARARPEREALDEVAVPLIVITETLRIVHYSHQLPPPLREGDSIRVEGEQLVAYGPVAAEIAKLFEPASEPTLRVFETGAEQDLVGLALRGPSGSSYVAIAWVPRSRWLGLDMEAIQRFYNLTSAESRVLESTLRHGDTSKAARELEIAEGTVRTQLKRIYQKTGTSSKTELLRRLLGGAGVLSAFAAGARRKVDAPSRARTEQILVLNDGSRLAFAEYGDPAGKPVMTLHNLFASRLQVPGTEAELYELGLRLIVPDRPGFGMSDWREGVTPRSFADDLVQLADHLQLDRMHLLGLSLGSVYALAAARYRSDRFERCTLVSCLADVRTSGDVERLHPNSRRVYKLVRRAPRLAEAALRLITEKGAGRFLDHIHLTEADRAVVDTQKIRDQAFAGLRETFRQGHAAFLQDVNTIVHGWEFETSDVPVPVQCWHGSEDIVAPPDLVFPLLRRIPRHQILLVPDGSHYVGLRIWSTVLARLADPDGPLDEKLQGYLERATSQE